ncbi:MAG TPA: GTP 3',8-cyclase MoaA [Candidatus Dormibacteraeota bacterium]|nr:GTP 3',8-cyclase MoaA [Candidatus Dormibacteraeota bacterium]
MQDVRDRLGRPLRDLRVSVTDRCNFRCGYCMPRETFGPGFKFLPRADVLSFEEIAKVVRIASDFGVRKVRITGGEPLLRRDLPRLVEQLAAIDGVEDLAMTTNGALLARYASDLAAAGLKRVTVSLDSVDEETFRLMNGVGVELAEVISGIDAAAAAGLLPIKLNAVVQRGVNERGILALAEFARARGHALRLIEYMDVGESHGWMLEQVVPAAELVKTIGQRWPLEEIPAGYPGEVASRYRYLDGAGELGMITSVTAPFCQSCTRLRLSADGKLHTCLFSRGGLDLRPVLRGGGDDAAVAAEIGALWGNRRDRYSEERAEWKPSSDGPKVEMSYLGG